MTTLTFIYMVPIDCKITNFFVCLFVSFLKDYHNYFLARLTISLVENLLASALCIH